MIGKTTVCLSVLGVLLAGWYSDVTPGGSDSNITSTLPTAAKYCKVMSEEAYRYTQSLPEEIRWMSNYAPVFQMNGDDIEIFQDLNIFRKILLEQIRLAERRVVLDSLYFGTGNSTNDLVEALRSSLSSHPDLHVTILTDYNCMVEGMGNPCSFLPALLKEHGDQVRASVYRSPELKEYLAWVHPILPYIIEVHHMKIYAFDDNLIVGSGNLDFLENEQDRYMFLRGSQPLVDFWEELVTSVASASFQIQPDYSLKMRTSVQDLRGTTGSNNVEAYKQEFKAHIEEVFNTYSKRNHSSQCDIHDNCDTWIVPLVQMGQFNIHLLSDVTEEFLRRTSENSHVTLTTPYFNLPEELERIMLYDSKATTQIVTTSQETSSVYTQAPITTTFQLGMYSMFERGFYGRLSGAGQEGRISLHEFVRDGWTYHAKGLWYYPPGEDSPTLTFVGSSNFNRQSDEKSLESELVVFTKNENLKEQLKKERDSFLGYSRQVNKETLTGQQTPLYIKLVSLMLKNYLLQVTTNLGGRKTRLNLYNILAPEGSTNRIDV